MNSLFPFGFPWPTALYLSLFVVTAAIYMVFMNYVFAGAIVLLAGYLAPGAHRRIDEAPAGAARSGLRLIVRVVRDWLPAVLTLAIITGIAPFLFLQVLYKQPFYTATVLLSNQFMMLLPALIVAYCMLYLVKGHALDGRRAVLRGPIMSVAFACFFYAAWAWTENHVLSIRENEWTIHYMSYNFVYRNAEIWPRLGYWITGSFATLAVAVGWQLHWGRRHHELVNVNLATRRLRALALLGLMTSAAEGWLWVLWLDMSARGPVLSLLALPYALMALTGIGVQVACWLPVKNGSNLTTFRLSVISIANAMTILSVLVVRESRRLAAVDITTLFDAHRQAAHVGGMAVFLVFVAITAAVITACVLTVKRALRPLT